MKNLKIGVITLLAALTITACANQSSDLAANVLNPNIDLKSPAEISTLLTDQNKASNLNILDVRTPAEFKAGCLKSAKNIDFEAPDFDTNISKLNKNANYLVYCRSGRRSALAVTKMKELGFANIVDMQGGFNAWQSNALPTNSTCN